MMTTVLGVELPSDPEQRKALFKYQADWHESMMVPVHGSLDARRASALT